MSHNQPIIHHNRNSTPVLLRVDHGKHNLYDAQELKTRVDLRDVVAHFWGQPDRKSNRYTKYFARWRDDGSQPSFTVYATRFKDYGGDGIAGDVFTFLHQELALDFRGTLEWLATYVGVLPQTRPAKINHVQLAQRPPHKNIHRNTTPVAPSPAWQSAAQQTLIATQNYLWSFRRDARDALTYLRSIRGLSDESIRSAGYGYNPAWREVDWVNPDTDKSIRLAPGIIEPWFADGQLWAIRIRCRVGNLAQALHRDDDILFDKPSPKYLNLAGSRQAGAIYNGDTITSEKDLLIVEGGFDAILAQQTLADQNVAVVTFGSATNLPTSKRLSQLRQAKRIFLLLDNDEAGQQAQARLIETLSNNTPSPTIHTVYLPQGKDVTDFIIQHHGNLAQALTNATKPAWWRTGVPNSIRSALLRYFRPATAPMIELINLAVLKGVIDPDTFTIDDLLNANQELGFNIPESTLRTVFKSLIGEFFSKLETNLFTQKTVSKNEKKSNRGRKADVYCLLPLPHIKQAIIAWATPRIIEKYHPTDDEAGVIMQPTIAMMSALGIDNPDEAQTMLDQLQTVYGRLNQGEREAQFVAGQRAMYRIRQLISALEETDSTSLPDNIALPNARVYRQVLLKATNDETQRRSRRDIQQLIGISNGSVGQYIKGAGLVKAQAHGEYEIEYLRHADNLAYQIQCLGREVKGRAMTIITMDADDNSLRESPYRGADSRTYVAEQIAQGRRVAIKFQVANRYIEADDTAEIVLPRRPKSHSAPLTQVAKPPKRKVNAYTKFYGRIHHPLWVRDQLILMLIRVGRVRYQSHPETPCYVDVATGEVYGCDVPAQMLLTMCE